MKIDFENAKIYVRPGSTDLRKGVTGLAQIIENEMKLNHLLIGKDSSLIGKDVRSSGLRDTYHCFVAGIEKTDGNLLKPDLSITFEEGDILWIVGEQDDLNRVQTL